MAKTAVAKTAKAEAATTAGGLPLTHTVQPADQAELTQLVADCYASQTPIYPLGGGTSLDWGLPARREGMGLALTGLHRIIDYPARDLTITVEAGLTWQALADHLAVENQELPIDVPQPERATVGGVIATNFNGPRRYGRGTIRDHVIGISAVDGRGTPFKGGGRVVKNVAGYDFCKLLTGSLGTLGIITQVTLRLKPKPAESALVACVVPDAATAEKQLAALSQSEVSPSAIELLGGPAWRADLERVAGGTTNRMAVKPESALLVVGLEGTTMEVEWMERRLKQDWESLGVLTSETWRGAEAAGWWRRLAEFPQAGESPLVLRANVAPSGTTAMLTAIRQLDPEVSYQSHAGSGVVLAKLSRIPDGGLSRTLIGRLQPVAAAYAGHMTVLSNPAGLEATHQSVWGGAGLPFDLMTSVKRQFDPLDLLNPGRFVYV